MKKRLRNAIAILGIVAMFFTAAMPAQAATTEGEQQPLQTEATEKFEYTVVTDKASLLTEEQIQNIEAKVGELQNYDVALYIENSDPQTCNQKYANTLSETMYAEVFGDYRNGIMIIFSFYKAENCYYAVHYGGNVNLTETKVSRIIEGTYHDYKTDATWVEGAFVQCIDYFKEAEAIPADTQSTVNESTRTPMATSTKVFLILFIVTAIIAVILLYNYLVLRNEKKYVDEELKNAKSNNSEIRSRNSELSSNLSAVTSERDNLKTWKRNAIAVHRTIQDEIDDWIARRDAEEFNKKYSSVIKLEPIMENFNQFDLMLGAYESMSNLAKSYVNLNMEIASKKRQEAGEAYAKAATEKIKNVCDHCTGSRHERHELNDTMSYYNGLPMFVRLMIAQSLVNRLNSAKSSADRAQKRYTSSQSSYRSSSSSHHGGTFGGSFHGGGSFGGHCGGGH